MSWLARQSDFAATNAKRITGGKGSELPFVPPFTNGRCRTQTPCQKKCLKTVVCDRYHAINPCANGFVAQIG